MSNQMGKKQPGASKSGKKESKSGGKTGKSSKKAGAKAGKNAGGSSGSPMSKADAKKLSEQIKKAASEMSSQGFNIELGKKTEGLKEGKKSLGGSQGGGAKAGKKEGKSKEQHITFNSKIEQMKKGKAGVEDGPGSTNESQGMSSFDPGAPKRKKNRTYDMTDAKYEKIYAPAKTETGKDMLPVKGKIGEGDSATIEVTKALPKGKPIETSYAEVYGEYREVAQKSINTQKVPKIYKDYVLEYFESINPDLRQSE